MEKTPEVSQAIDASLVEAKRLFEIFEKFYQEFLTATMNGSTGFDSVREFETVVAFRHELRGIACCLMAEIEEIGVCKGNPELLDTVEFCLRRLQISLVLRTPDYVSEGQNYLNAKKHTSGISDIFDVSHLDELINQIWNLLGYAPHIFAPLNFHVKKIPFACNHPLPKPSSKAAEAE